MSSNLQYHLTLPRAAFPIALHTCCDLDSLSSIHANTNISLKIKPVQKQTRAGQRTRFKAIVVIGDSEGHVGLGIKTSKEVATAIRAAIIIAKLSVLPIRRGYWGTSLGEPHSLPTKESGKCGSVTVRVGDAVYSRLYQSIPPRQLHGKIIRV